MARQFRHTYTVRYDEADIYSNLTPTAFLRYMQDIAALDAEDANVDDEGYWIVKRTIVSFHQPVPLLGKLEITTYGMGFTRITAQRAYDARIIGAENQDPIISARSTWVHVDAHGKPSRIPASSLELWQPDSSISLQTDQPWLPFPQDQAEHSDYTVRFSDIDSIGHMNNAAYVETLDNVAWDIQSKLGLTPETTTVSALEYEVEYKESARLGDQLAIQTWFDPTPASGQDTNRLQLITRKGVELVRARSRWQIK